MKLKLEDKLKIITMYENGHFAPLISKILKFLHQSLNSISYLDPDKLAYNIAYY